jgi:hypothetical protein
VITRYAEHALDPRGRSLLAEYHLQYCLIDWFASYLTTEVIQFSMGNLEHCCGVSMLRIHK